jgi:hypothetical protein
MISRIAETVPVAIAGAIAAGGGTVHARLASVGWIFASMPVGLVESLAVREDVRRIEWAHTVEDGADPVTLQELESESGSRSHQLAGYDGEFCDPLCTGGLVG